VACALFGMACSLLAEVPTQVYIGTYGLLAEHVCVFVCCHAMQMLPASGGISPANLARAMLEVYGQVRDALLRLCICKQHARPWPPCHRPPYMHA
jgi:hypothetical protein